MFAGFVSSSWVIFDFSLTKALSEEDVKHLKTMEGVWDAYEGVRALGGKLKVCQISGSAVILSSSVKAEFQQAPHFIREKFDAVEKDHLENYGELLKSKLTPEAGSTPNVPTVDPRPNIGAEETNVQAETLPSFESEAKLREQYTIKVECKAFDPKNVIVLVSDQGVGFIYSKEPVTLKRGTRLGGVGSGKLSQGDETGLQFELLSDRDLIEAIFLEIVTN